MQIISRSRPLILSSLGLRRKIRVWIIGQARHRASLFCPLHVNISVGQTFQNHGWRHSGSSLGTQFLVGLIVWLSLRRHAENESVKLGAIKEILDRSLGKAPQNVDITALRHTRSCITRRQRSAKPCSTAVGRRYCCYVPPNKDDEK